MLQFHMMLEAGTDLLLLGSAFLKEERKSDFQPDAEGGTAHSGTGWE